MSDGTQYYLPFAELKVNVIQESLKPHTRDVWCVGFHVDDWVSSWVYQPVPSLDEALEYAKRLPRPLWIVAHRGYVVAESPVTLDLVDSWVKEVGQRYQREIDGLNQQLEWAQAEIISRDADHATPPTE